jgi:hypothetical protein
MSIFSQDFSFNSPSIEINSFVLVVVIVFFCCATTQVEKTVKENISSFIEFVI